MAKQVQYRKIGENWQLAGDQETPSVINLDFIEVEEVVYEFRVFDDVSKLYSKVHKIIGITQATRQGFMPTELQLSGAGTLTVTSDIAKTYDRAEPQAATFKINDVDTVLPFTLNVDDVLTVSEAVSLFESFAPNVIVKNLVGQTVYNFDGVDDFIDFGNPTYADGTFSAGCWFKTTDDLLRLWQNTGTGGFSQGFQISANAGSWSNTFLWTAASEIRFTGPFTENDGQWHNVYLTFDPATETAKLYIDGILKETLTGNGTGGNVNPHRNLTFGAAWDDVATQSQHYLGATYDGRVYNRVLSDVEVLDIVENGTLIENGLQILVPANGDTDGIADNPYGVSGTILNHNPATFYSTL